MTFGQRTGSFIPYPGLRQVGDTCVYASVAGAINHLCSREVWTLSALFTKCAGRTPDFGVARQAVEPVAGEVAYRVHSDDARTAPPETWLDLLRNHVDKGGIAIISLEAARRHPPGPQRMGAWHMFTLVARSGDLYQVWDTNGIHAFVTQPELVKLEYPNGLDYIIHDRQETLLLCRK